MAGDLSRGDVGGLRGSADIGRRGRGAVREASRANRAAAREASRLDGPAPSLVLPEQRGTDSTRAHWTVQTGTDPQVWQPAETGCSEWDRLWARCQSSTAFLHSAWLSSWWRCYSEGRALHVVLVRRDGELLAAAPLQLCRRGPFTVFALVGTGISDFGGVLVADDAPDAAEALLRLRDALADLPYPIDLRELPADGHARQLAEGWPHEVRRWSDSPCLSLPAHTFEDTVRALPRRTAARVRNKARRIDDVGVLALTTPADQAVQYVAELMRLHQDQWRDRGISAEHLTERFHGHLAAAIPALIEAGYADLVRYQLDGELLGCELMLHSRSIAGSYLSGFSPLLRQKLDLATMMLRHGLDLAVQREAVEYSMLRGLEPYKLRWSPALSHNQRLLLGTSSRTTTRLYAQAVSGRKRLVKVAKAVLRREDLAATAQEIRARIGCADQDQDGETTTSDLGKGEREHAG